jgi:hypothetical protein
LLTITHCLDVSWSIKVLIPMIPTEDVHCASSVMTEAQQNINQVDGTQEHPDARQHQPQDGDDDISAVKKYLDLTAFNNKDQYQVEIDEAGLIVYSECCASQMSIETMKKVHAALGEFLSRIETGTHRGG